MLLTLNYLLQNNKTFNYSLKIKSIKYVITAISAANIVAIASICSLDLIKLKRWKDEYKYKYKNMNININMKNKSKT